MIKHHKANDLINFVTYNTQFCTGLDGQIDIARIIRTVQKADLICLQEIDRYWARTGMTDQAEIIASYLPNYFWAFGPGIDMDGSFRSDKSTIKNRRRQHGNMILSRWPLITVRNHLLPKMAHRASLSTQRSALEAVINLPNGPCRIYSVHLAHSSQIERKKQISRLLSIVQDAKNDGGAWSGTDVPLKWQTEGMKPPSTSSTIIAGDFNFTPDTSEYIQICSQTNFREDMTEDPNSLFDAWLYNKNEPNGGHTWIHKDPPRRLDYIMASADIVKQIDAMWVDLDSIGSDHKPLWSTIRSD